MATVRVFVPTYQRPHLLRRALESLRAQTFSDWTAEVHNDAPDDPIPAEITARLADPRITYHRHERNLGGTATFNLFFRATPEPFYALLEDDNAWTPAFLATMLDVARAHSDVTVVWSNQSIWRESPDGTVHRTDACVHALGGETAPRRIAWGQPAQIFGALHAHSAALFRSRPGDTFVTPAVPIALVEAFRERMFPYPLVFVPQPLAAFTVTRRSARSDDHAEWAVVQTMLAATFLEHAGYTPAELDRLWRDSRSRHPPATSTLLLAGLVEPGCRFLLPYAQPIDWLRLVRGIIRRPHVLSQIAKSKRIHPDWWSFLRTATAAQFRASQTS